MGLLEQELRRLGVGAFTAPGGQSETGNVYRDELRNRVYLGLGESGIFVSEAVSSSSEIRVSKGGPSVDGKSILDILSLAVEPGDLLTIEAKGIDAGEAINKLSALIDRGFGIVDAEMV